LIGKIVEYVKFGYSHVEFNKQTYLKQDMSRQVETPLRLQAVLPGFKR
jgi:hypothetical protein